MELPGQQVHRRVGVVAPAIALRHRLGIVPRPDCSCVPSD